MEEIIEHDGYVRGLNEGHASGVQEGHASGIKEGLARGIAENQRNIATNMLAKGMDAALITFDFPLVVEIVDTILVPVDIMERDI